MKSYKSLNHPSAGQQSLAGIFNTANLLSQQDLCHQQWHPRDINISQDDRWDLSHTVVRSALSNKCFQHVWAVLVDPYRIHTPVVVNIETHTFSFYLSTQGCVPIGLDLVIAVESWYLEVQSKYQVFLSDYSWDWRGPLFLSLDFNQQFFKIFKNKSAVKHDKINVNKKS